MCNKSLSYKREKNEYLKQRNRGFMGASFLKTVLTFLCLTIMKLDMCILFSVNIGYPHSNMLDYMHIYTS